MAVQIQRLKVNIKSISIHVVIWLMVFSINYIFLKNNVIKFDLKFNLLTWVVYISLFYISYSFLIPYFLFKKKVIAFVAGSMIILSLSYLINVTIERNQFITVLKQRDDTLAKIHSNQMSSIKDHLPAQRYHLPLSLTEKISEGMILK